MTAGVWTDDTELVYVIRVCDDCQVINLWGLTMPIHYWGVEYLNNIRADFCPVCAEVLDRCKA